MGRLAAATGTLVVVGGFALAVFVDVAGGLHPDLLTGCCDFVEGRIVSLQATVLPANGDYGSPEMGRFVDSVSFSTHNAPNNAIELPAPPK